MVILNSMATSAWLFRWSSVRTKCVGTFTILSVLLNLSTLIAKPRPYFLRNVLLWDWHSIALFIDVVCVKKQRIGMIRTCNLQYADAAQPHTIGSACQGLPSHWRRCPILHPHLSCYASFVQLHFLVFLVFTVTCFVAIFPLKRMARRVLNKERGITFFQIRFWSTACVLIFQFFNCHIFPSVSLFLSRLQTYLSH